MTDLQELALSTIDELIAEVSALRRQREDDAARILELETQNEDLERELAISETAMDAHIASMRRLAKDAYR